jgi:hypothetical protein
MDEYGLFNDEGCVEAGIWSMSEAQQRLADYNPGDDLHISIICPEHSEQEKDTCEECS